MARVVFGCYGNVLQALLRNNILSCFSSRQNQSQNGSILHGNFVISSQKVWRVCKYVQWIASKESTAKGAMGIEDACNDSKSVRWWYWGRWWRARWTFVQFPCNEFLVSVDLIYFQRNRKWWFRHESTGDSTSTGHNTAAWYSCKKSATAISEQ